MSFFSNKVTLQDLQFLEQCHLMIHILWGTTLGPTVNSYWIFEGASYLTNVIIIYQLSIISYHIQFMHLPDNTNILFLKLVYKPSQQSIIQFGFFLLHRTAMRSLNTVTPPLHIFMLCLDVYNFMYCRDKQPAWTVSFLVWVVAALNMQSDHSLPCTLSL